jgi:hypothetical protein
MLPCPAIARQSCRWAVSPTAARRLFQAPPCVARVLDESPTLVPAALQGECSRHGRREAYRVREAERRLACLFTMGPGMD